MALKSSGRSDAVGELCRDIERAGYYPEVVTDAVLAAVAGEQVVAHYVHHEARFDRDEVRRHLSAMALTPSRLVIIHTDEHSGDDLLPEPYASTTTEAIALRAITSVVVTRMITNPTAGPRPPAEAVLTIGWNGAGRIDLEPAGCQDPQCDADHGYTGVLTADSYSQRVSSAGEGNDAVVRILRFAEALSARTQGS